MEQFPFSQEHADGKITRTFAADCDEEELKWHQDLKERTVLILKSEGWKYQDEDGLPITLKEGDVLKIPALKWHRAIKGEGILKVEITES